MKRDNSARPSCRAIAGDACGGRQSRHHLGREPGSARWWLLPLPAVAARLFVSFRGATRNGFRARQSGASIPAYRDMQLEAHRIQDIQEGSETWMLRMAFKSTIDRRSFKPGYFGDIGGVVQTDGRANGMTNFGDFRRLKRAIDAIGNLAAARSRVCSLRDFSDTFSPTK